jgi:hypothetical protein
MQRKTQSYMITVAGSESISAVETYIEDLNRRRGRCDLSLPTKLRGDRFGGKAGLIQLILTWARKCHTSSLVTHIQKASDVDVQLENLALEDHGLVALLAASEVLSRRRQPIGATPLAYCVHEYEEVYQRARQKGTRSLFLVADHLTDTSRDSFYDHLAVSDAIRAEKKQSFIREVYLRIEMCIGRSRSSRLSPDQKKSIGEIIYELFSNTERWGQHDVEWKQLQPSVRGLLIEVHSDPGRYLAAASGSAPIESYLNSLGPNLGKNAGMLEISVFDSGVGLASRALEKRSIKNVAIDAEHAAVLGCLVLHGTSSGDETEGIGLYHTLKLLSRSEGFLRYRGGRLALYRDFKEHPYLPEKYESLSVRRTGRSTARDTLFRQDLAFLLDWNSRSLGATAMAPVEGALFTLLLPLPNLINQPEQLDLLAGDKA